MPTSGALTEAGHHGFSLGVVATANGRDCPYTHAEPALRDAWFAGFSRGRAATEPDRAPDVERVDPGGGSAAPPSA